MPRSRWYCASLSVGYDLVTASFSVADMVCDYLVLLQFYTDGRPVFFALSLVVMLLAHATYACLFTQKYVPDHTTNQHGRIVAVFLAALPVSQFVPLFIYLESLDLPFMRRAMRKCGLRSDQGGGVDQQEGTDPFWVSMREKASAHSGFLAEAVAEAVPQCALQTVAAVLDGELRYLNLVSILLSIAVITSKCWVLSYSLHVPTMCFNAICVAADVLALFGTLCWLFSPSVWVVPTHVSLGVGLLFDGTMRGTLLLLAALAVGLLVGAVGLLIVGEVFDKILCLRRKRIPEHDRVAAVFGFCAALPVAYVAAVVPAAVLHLSLKWSYVPTLLLQSLDPEHALRHDFYRPMFAYLDGRATAAAPPPPPPEGGTPPPPARAAAAATPPAAGSDDAAAAAAATTTTTTAAAPAAAPDPEAARAELRALRGKAVSTYLKLAHGELPTLRRRLRTATTLRLAQQEAAAWARAVGHGEGTATIVDAVQAAAAERGANGGRGSSARPAREPRPATRVERAHYEKHLSETRPWVMSRLPVPKGAEGEPLWTRPLLPEDTRICASGAADACLQVTSAALLFGGCFLLLLWPIAAAAMTLFSLAYPIIQPLVLLAEPGVLSGEAPPPPLLASVMSALYAGCVVALALLAPAVRRFRKRGVQLEEAKNFPQGFYCAEVVAVVQARCEAAVRAARQRDRVASARRGSGQNATLLFGDDCSICLQKLEEGDVCVVSLRNCGHSFHRDCVAGWLRERQRCPNCRARCHASDLPSTTAEVDAAAAAAAAATAATAARAAAALEEGDDDDDIEMVAARAAAALEEGFGGLDGDDSDDNVVAWQVVERDEGSDDEEELVATSVHSETQVAETLVVETPPEPETPATTAEL